MTYTLIHGPTRREEAPYTFFLPSPELIEAIRPGDHVKVGFEYDPPGEEFCGERMWVLVTSVSNGRYHGTIDNEPSERIVSYGDAVEFGSDEVLDVMLANKRCLPALARRREYWDRCLVDNCVLNDDVHVEYIYREPPEPLEDAEHGDSGWRIRGRQGSETDDEMEKREVSFVALGAVLNRDDSWVHLLDEPEGSAFMRNFATNTYDAVA